MAKELGFIKIEDVLELVKLVHRVNMETGHNASIDLKGEGYNILVTVVKDGEDTFDIFEYFNIYNPKSLYESKLNACTYSKIRFHLEKLLGEKNEII